MAFGYYKAVTLAAAQAGSADSTDWPLAICLDGNVHAADADLKTTGNGGYVENANGYDIRPYDGIGGSALVYELVYYQATTGKLEMHVKIPTLSHSADTVIYLYFGDAALSTDGSSTSTWNSAYLSVWHLGDATTLTGADSTSNANTGTLLNTPTAVAGDMVGGAHFVGASAQGMLGANVINIANVTLEAWVYLTGNPAASALVVGFSDGLGSATFDKQLYIDTGGKPFFYFYDGSTKTTSDPGANVVPLNQWVHLAATANSTTAVMYLNGVSVGTVAAGATFTGYTVRDFFVAASQPSGTQGYLIGNVDEVRLSNVGRSASWVLSDYNSQKASSSFIAWGSKTAVGGGGGASALPVLTNLYRQKRN